MKYVSLAKPGDIACCVNGHELYRVTSDIVPTSVMQSAMFDPIGYAPKPEPRKQIEVCHLCGTPWVTAGPGGGYVFCNLKRKLEI
jgi:succinyl-CoA synthetase beta subunit